MNTSIETVTGQVASSDLGQTLMHEHVFVLNQEIESNYPGRWDETHRMVDARERLDELYSSGVRTLVDLTVIGLGRYIPRIVELAQDVKIQIVVATGLYTYADVPMFFRHRGPGKLMDGPEPLTEFFIRDITQGIADTGVRAGILKCATDETGVTPDIDRILRAVAQAHLETGAPISTHTHAVTERGLEQQAIFKSEGVDLERVVIGHSGDTKDLNYLEKLMEAGSYIGMDRFGLDLMLSFEDRVNTVVELCRRGYAERIVLSHDASCYTHNFDEDRKREAMPNWNYLHIHNHVLPALLEGGVTPEQVEQMLVINPAQILPCRMS